MLWRKAQRPPTPRWRGVVLQDPPRTRRRSSREFRGGAVAQVEDADGAGALVGDVGAEAVGREGAGGAVDGDGGDNWERWAQAPELSGCHERTPSVCMVVWLEGDQVPFTPNHSSLSVLELQGMIPLIPSHGRHQKLPPEP